MPSRKSKIVDQYGDPILVEHRSKYDAAQTTDENKKHWSQADALSAIEANNPATRKKLVTRSRYEKDNDPIYGGLLRTHSSDIFGTGPTLQSLIAQQDKLNARIEQKFTEQFGAIGLIAGLLTAGESKDGDGEAIGIMREATVSAVTGLPLEVPLDVQFVETEQCATPRKAIPKNEANWVDGIELDSTGRPLAYHILRTHPGSSYATEDFERVPADQVLFWMRRSRPGQRRAVPECTASLPLGAQRRRWALATLTAAETAANIAVLITSKLPTDFIDADLPKAWETVEWVRNAILTLPAGGDATQIKPEHPTQEYSPFKHEIMKEMGRPIGAPYSVVGLDGSEHNYSSLRYEREVYYSGIDVERVLCAMFVLNPFVRAWYSIARMIPGYLADDISTLPANLPFSWNWPGRPALDPLKEAMADTEALTNGSKNLKEILAARGVDWQAHLRQRKAERDFYVELGLPLPKWLDPGAGLSQPAGATPARTLDAQPADTEESQRHSLKLALLKEDAS